MTQNQLDIVQINAVVAQLAAAKPVDDDDKIEINNAMTGLLRVVARRSSASHQASVGDTKPVSPVDEISGLQPFEFSSMSVSEASVAYMRTLEAKDAQATVDLVKAVKKYGYQFEGAHPNASATAALRRREKGVGDIVQVGRGKWGLRDWYSQREITAFNHAERTKAGLKSSPKMKKKAGHHSWMLNEAQAAEFLRMAAEGCSNSHLAEVFGMSVGGAGNYKAKLKNWKPGEPYPPTRTDDDAPNLRAVK